MKICLTFHIYISLYSSQASFKNLCKGIENRNILSSEFFMGKFNKRSGESNFGGKNKNRTGGQGYSGPGHGQNHTKDNNHRMRTQKNQGRRQGGSGKY